MDGVLIIDKSAGMTSHDIVNRVRRILKTKRVGHTGTLDPFATGVIVLLVGKATRLAQFVDNVIKEYVAEIRFGFATDTGDLTGTPIGEEKDVDFTAADLENVLAEFRGGIEQIPPMFSAKKVAGKKLYEHARKGETVERRPTSVTIYEIALLETNFDAAEQSARIRVASSAGTYIRTLAEDIGRSLGIGAHLTALRRTAAGSFTLKHAISLNELETAEDPKRFLFSKENVVADLPRVELPKDRVAATLNGMSTRFDRDVLGDVSAVAMFSADGSLIAVGAYDPSESCIKPKIVLG